ncbi:MAG: hypothetical protein PSY12_00860 [bacterium]|nr:hypothetical protein [bacterium]
MTDEEIARVARGFLDGTLPKAEWTHGAHFATALWLMRAYPDAESEMPDRIRRYNASVGGVNSDIMGYHHTITLASLRMARRVLAGLPLDVRIDHAFAVLMASPLGDKDWPFAYWSRDRLLCVAARRDWVEPDIAPLPT